MSARIDHEARKRELALKAVELFSREGYGNVSMLGIAADANIARTLLYRYFRSKREILDAAIRATTAPLLEECWAVAREAGSAVGRLERICITLTTFLFRRRSFLAAVFDFVLATAREGEEMGPRIHAFTHGICDVFERLAEEGASSGEFRSRFAPHRVAETLYMGLEAFTLRIVLGVDKDTDKALMQLLGMVRAVREN